MLGMEHPRSDSCGRNVSTRSRLKNRHTYETGCTTHQVTIVPGDEGLGGIYNLLHHFTPSSVHIDYFYCTVLRHTALYCTILHFSNKIWEDEILVFVSAYTLAM